MVRFLNQLIHSGLRRCGLDLKRFSPSNDPHLRRQAILSHYGIDLALDIGANEGQYAKRLREYGYAGRILSVEPGSEPFAALQRASASMPPWSCLQLALARQAGTARLNLTANSVSSSLLEGTPAMEVIPGSEVIGEEVVQVCTLDELGSEHLPRFGAMLVKLDVQGSEQAVLDGGPQVLERTTLLEIELAWNQLYRGQALGLELLNQLSALGLDLVSMTPNTLDPCTGQVLEFDALLARRPKGQ